MKAKLLTYCSSRGFFCNRTAWWMLLIFWFFILFLSFVQSLNFIGDYSNYSNDQQTSGLLPSSSEMTKAMIIASVILTMTVLTILLTVMCAMGIISSSANSIFFKYQKQSIVGVLIFFIGKVISSAYFLADSSQSFFFSLEDTLNAELSLNKTACVEAFPEDIDLCRVVFSFTFLYRQEIFFLCVSFFTVIPFSILTKKIHIDKIIQFQNQMKENQELIGENDKKEQQLDRSESKDLVLGAGDRRKQLDGTSLDETRIQQLNNSQQIQYKETINLNENDDSRYYPDFRDEAYQDY